MAYVLKMEYVSKINIFGLKMMVIIFEIPACAHRVIFITEFVLLTNTPPFYEVNPFNRKC